MLTVAVVPLNLTVSFVVVVLKFVPVIVTLVPTPPEGGVKLVIVGFNNNVNVALLVAVGEFKTATVIFPVVAPVGTVVTSWVAVADVTTAWVPLNLTMLFAGVVLKFVPVMVTIAPTPAEPGVKLVMVGAVTVKLLPLVAVPALPTVTVIVPVVVPASTTATICVVVAEVIEPVVPWNLTVSLAMVLLKLVPIIVTVVPMGPLRGEKLEMVGAAAQTDPAATIIVRQRRIRRIEAGASNVLARVIRKVFNGLPLLCAALLSYLKPACSCYSSLRVARYSRSERKSGDLACESSLSILTVLLWIKLSYPGPTRVCRR